MDSETPGDPDPGGQSDPKPDEGSAVAAPTDADEPDATAAEDDSGAVDQDRAAGLEVEDVIRRLDERAAAGRDAGRSAVAELDAVEDRVDEIASRMHALDGQGEEVATAGETGREGAEAILTEIEELVEYRDEVEAYVEQLVTGMEEIRDVAAVIEDVADRTNILAMNAAIEAARAGEGGAGFGVVADEVKALAEQTGERVEEIDETIDRMGEASGGSVVALEELDERLESSAGVAEDTFEAIDTVAETIGEAVSEIGRVAELADGGVDVARGAASEVEGAASAAGEVADLAGELREVREGGGGDGSATLSTATDAEDGSTTPSDGPEENEDE